MPSSNTPVIVGVAQVIQRPEEVELEQARGPIELMTEAARAAAVDAGHEGLLTGAELVGVTGEFWRYHNPAEVIAAKLGCPRTHTMLTYQTGTAPQDLVAAAAERISNGTLEVALVLGGHAGRSRRALRRAGNPYPWNVDPGSGDPEMLSEMPAATQHEIMAIGAVAPLYALMEDALRHQAGRSVDEQRNRIAGLWSAFSAVAAANPYAWDNRFQTPEQVRAATANNRMIAFPYTKAMVANNTVDAASAIIVCAESAADRFGLDRARRIYPQTVVNTHETWTVQARRDLHRCPALETAVELALESTEAQVTDVDLYACFPSIVQIAADVLGLPLNGSLTKTGGLALAGAAIANAVGHSLAAMVTDLRAGGGVGLVHGNGGAATVHSVGIYATEPPDEGFRRIDGQHRVRLNPRGSLPDGWSGPVAVEAATVVDRPDGQREVLASVTDSSGARVFARSTDPRLRQRVQGEGLAGANGHRSAEGELHASG